MLPGDQWDYLVPTSQPSSNWNQLGFNSSSWNTGNSGFGYGDGDDATIVSSTMSIYIRKIFTITNASDIESIILDLDYDDGFVYWKNKKYSRSKMKEGAEAKAKEAGIDLSSYAGKVDGDAGPQITAIENCMAAGAKGILITASNDSVIPALKKARAAGILVIALDTPIADPEAQDMTCLLYTSPSPRDS